MDFGMWHLLERNWRCICCQWINIKVIHRICMAICELRRHYINFPDATTQVNYKVQFYKCEKLPGVIYYINTTRIPAKRPSTPDAVEYSNRKNWFSIMGYCLVTMGMLRLFLYLYHTCHNWALQPGSYTQEGSHTACLVFISTFRNHSDSIWDYAALSSLQQLFFTTWNTMDGQILRQKRITVQMYHQLQQTCIQRGFCIVAFQVVIFDIIDLFLHTFSHTV